jgi:hypothetical protein
MQWEEIPNWQMKAQNRDCAAPGVSDKKLHSADGRNQCYTTAVQVVVELILVKRHV